MPYRNLVAVTHTLDRVIAVDFDGCLCKNAWPYVGEPNWDVIEKVKQEQNNGASIILWTCRDGQLLEDAKKACKEWGIKLAAANESLLKWREAWGNDTRKIGATEYWDDKAFNPIHTAEWVNYKKHFEEAGTSIQWARCSYCGEDAPVKLIEHEINKSMYCPHCGRRMLNHAR